MATGPLTTDGIPIDALRTEMNAALSLVPTKINLRNALSLDTVMTTVDEGNQGGILMQKVDEFGTVPLQHQHRGEIALPEPVQVRAGTGVTKHAIAKGISSEQIRDNFKQLTNAWERWTILQMVRALLTDGGWYTAGDAAPDWASNAFVLGAHDHYVGYNVAGVPTLAHFAASKRLIREHGYQGQIVAVMNGAVASRIEAIPEWATAPAILATPQMERLAEMGFTAEFTAAGVPVMTDDWVPDGYIALFDVDAKSMRWRLPIGSPSGAPVAWTSDIPDEVYSIKWYIEGWGQPTITKLGAGVALYLGNAVYASPAFPELALPLI